jgi:hypothetical protein
LSAADLHPARGIAKVATNMQTSRKCLDGVRRAKKPDSTRRLAVSEAIPDEMPGTTAVPCCFAFTLLIACLHWSIDLGDIQVDTCIAERMQVFTWKV